MLWKLEDACSERKNKRLEMIFTLAQPEDLRGFNKWMSRRSGERLFREQTQYVLWSVGR